MFNQILKGLKILITGKQFIDSIRPEKPLVIPTNVPNPLPNLQHPAAVGEKTKEKKMRKPADTTVLTQLQIDFIKGEYRRLQQNNANLPWSERISTMELTHQLNELFGLHKSRQFYSRIWNDHTTDDSTND